MPCHPVKSPATPGKEAIAREAWNKIARYYHIQIADGTGIEIIRSAIEEAREHWLSEDLLGVTEQKLANENARLKPRAAPPRREGHSALPVKEGKLEKLDPHPAAQSQKWPALAAEWAADDRKWNTQEIVETNLIAFATAAIEEATDEWRTKAQYFEHEANKFREQAERYDTELAEPRAAQPQDWSESHCDGCGASMDAPSKTGLCQRCRDSAQFDKKEIE